MSRLVALVSAVWLAILVLLVTAVPVYAVDTSPSITSFAPTGGRAGIDVVITGTYFTAASVVKFNGTIASSRTVNSATSITATVPGGTSTGKITVTTVYGTATSSNNFTITPSITSFAPTELIGGEIVTITGSSFTGTTQVFFLGDDGTHLGAQFNVVNDTAILATVPDFGFGHSTFSHTGPISVTTAGGTDTSSTKFTVYPPAALDIFIDPGAGYFGAKGLIVLNYRLEGPFIYTGKLTSDNSGKATIDGFHPGTYNLTLSGSHWLNRSKNNINAKGTINGVPDTYNSVSTILANGDANGDGQVNLFDFVVLDSKFGSSDPMADLDGDGHVNLFDYMIIDQNFGALGDM